MAFECKSQFMSIHSAFLNKEEMRNNDFVLFSFVMHFPLVRFIKNI